MDGNAVEGEVLAVERNVVLRPQQAHHLDSFVGSAAALTLGDAARFVLAGVAGAESNGGQRTSAGEVVERGDLLSEHRGVAQREREYIGAELQLRRSGGYERQRYHRFDVDHFADDAVAKPKRIYVQPFALVGVLPEVVRVFGWKRPPSESYANLDGHLRLLARNIAILHETGGVESGETLRPRTRFTIKHISDRLACGQA